MKRTKKVKTSKSVNKFNPEHIDTLIEESNIDELLSIANAKATGKKLLEYLNEYYIEEDEQIKGRKALVAWIESIEEEEDVVEEEENRNLWGATIGSLTDYKDRICSIEGDSKLKTRILLILKEEGTVESEVLEAHAVGKEIAQHKYNRKKLDGYAIEANGSKWALLDGDGDNYELDIEDEIDIEIQEALESILEEIEEERKAKELAKKELLAKRSKPTKKGKRSKPMKKGKKKKEVDSDDWE